jgi:hypothetical protein
VVANAILELDGGRVIRERAVQAGDPKQLTPSDEGGS